MEYTKAFFDPASAEGAVPTNDGGVAVRPPGGQPGDLYVYSARIILAVNVALATRRPLLISGEPGSGKSTLAKNAAAILKWRYYKRVVSSRTQASDLLWTFDALQRLNDATTPTVQVRSKQHYVTPGVLWWAFDAPTAGCRGKGTIAAEFQLIDPSGHPERPHAIVLVDEIDKADPDVPNDLLEPFDVKEFTVRDTGDTIRQGQDTDVLLMLTTNGERELPRAFLRRCVTLRLDDPTADRFTTIAAQRFGGEHDLHTAIAAEVMWLRDEARKKGIRPPSTGEYLDAVEACRALDPDPDKSAWREMLQSVLWKSDTPLPQRGG